MNIAPYAPDNEEEWDQFCLKSDDAWFWHTRPWAAYTAAYRPDLKPADLSFIVREGKEIQAVVPLFVEEFSQEGYAWKELSFAGDAAPAPALLNTFDEPQRAATLDYILGFIDGLAAELQVARSSFRISPLIPRRLRPELPPFNHLLRHGYLDASLGTQMILLQRPETILWNQLRRNHLRNIEKARESLKLNFYDSRNITEPVFERYREMHKRAAGRVTRSRETFRMMLSWVQTGHGLLTEACLLDGKPVGYELYIIDKNAVYGASACNEPGFGKMPIRHLVEWESILWMKNKGLEFYEIGTQHFGALPHDCPDKKNKDISDFKYGFGGVTVPSTVGEKFYSKAHWQRATAQRAQAFGAAPEWEAAVPGREQAALFLRQKERMATASEKQSLAESPLPAEAVDIAREILRSEPDSVRQAKTGNTRVIDFLVGKAVRRAPKSVPPEFIKRAIEQELNASS